MYKPTLRQIEYFVTLADKLSFSRTAESLNVTQSTLSNAIREMEYGLALNLFERDSRNVSLTAEGQRLYEEGRALLSAQDRFLQRADTLKHSGRVSLRLGVIPTIAPFVLPDLLARNAASDKPFHLSITETLTKHVLEKLDAREIDVGLIALPYPLETRFRTLELYNDPFYLATPQAIQTKLPQKITLSDMDDLKLLLLEDGHCLRDQAISECHLARASVQADFSGSSLETVLSLVEQGLGCSLVPEMLLPHFEGRMRIDFHPFKIPAPQRSIALVTLSGAQAENMTQMGHLLLKKP
ncbi:MAG: LysR family transcriptional regulator [Pseudobdellovibrionaceae bacterium]